MVTQELRKREWGVCDYKQQKGISVVVWLYGAAWSLPVHEQLIQRLNQGFEEHLYTDLRYPAPLLCCLLTMIFSSCYLAFCQLWTTFSNASSQETVALRPSLPVVLRGILGRVLCEYRSYSVQFLTFTYQISCISACFWSLFCVFE